MTMLSLELCALIADSVLNGLRLETSDLAGRFGVTRDGINKFRHRVKAAGGWFTELAVSTCLECGQPMFVPVNSRHHARALHQECRAARHRALMVLNNLT